MMLPVPLINAVQHCSSPGPPSPPGTAAGGTPPAAGHCCHCCRQQWLLRVVMLAGRSRVWLGRVCLGLHQTGQRGGGWRTALQANRAECVWVSTQKRYSVDAKGSEASRGSVCWVGGGGAVSGGFTGSQELASYGKLTG
jgi:hypothetical protein